MSLRRLALVAIALMASQAALHIVRPMTSYRLLAFGEGSTSIGIVTAAFALAPLFLAVPLSRFATGARTAWIAVVGGLGMVGGCVGLALMTGTLEAVGATVLLGIGHIGVMLATQILITSESPDDRYDRNFGIFTAGASLGQLVGPIAGTSVLTAADGADSGTAAAMFIAAGACVVATLAAVALVPGGRGVHLEGSEPKGPSTGFRTVLAYPGSLSAVYVGLVVLSAIDILTAYLPVLGEQSGIPPLTVGLLLSIRAAASIASRLLIGRLVAWTSRSIVLIASTASAAVVIALLPLSTNRVALVAMMAVLGAGLGFGQPLTMSWLTLLVPSSLRGRALAVRLVGNRLGQVLTPVSAAAVSGAVGASAVFWMLGVLLVTSTAVATQYHRRSSSAPEEG